ncbi:protein ABHD8 [Pyrgilauda ruficollis]|uniref:protein ABHD8 n=1 Tax=Pyrgilauda ruficollis TaxID=221976 RepID=UPI001B8612EA|nr:protein ABHD8 [Pyrgilauda ruficollis]
MLTSITDGFLCCLLGKTPNAVGPLDSVESSDGFTFLEVKPGRILRIHHSVPERPRSPRSPRSPERGAVRCQRRITLYRNGQLLIENLSEAQAPRCPLPDANGEPGAPDPAGAAAKRRKRKPKRVVTVDCKKRITSCKGTHGDVVLFFIHGVGGSLDIWKEQLEFFSKLGYEVVAPDLAGHGCSSAPPVAAAYTFYALAEDMRAVFKRYAKKRNILIGHSYGVSFCTFLAHEYPDLVHKVIMINGGGPTALEPSLCSIFNLPPCVLHCLSPCLAWSFLKEGTEWHLGARATSGGSHRAAGCPQILLIAFLKVIDEGSHMVMLECPDTVNTLLHEFVLWEPDTPAARGDGDTK